MLSMAKRSLASWVITLFATSTLAHPLFNGRLVSRADELLSEYDYVIIGAGASGLTVANRLSEQSSQSSLNIGSNQDVLTAGRYYCLGHRSRAIVSRSNAPKNAILTSA
jgi:malic enzyme